MMLEIPPRKEHPVIAWGQASAVHQTNNCQQPKFVHIKGWMGICVPLVQNNAMVSFCICPFVQYQPGLFSYVLRMFFSLYLRQGELITNKIFLLNLSMQWQTRRSKPAKPLSLPIHANDYPRWAFCLQTILP